MFEYKIKEKYIGVEVNKNNGKFTLYKSLTQKELAGLYRVLGSTFITKKTIKEKVAKA